MGIRRGRILCFNVLTTTRTMRCGMEEPGGQMEARHLAELCISRFAERSSWGTKLLSLDSCQKEPHGLDEVKALKFEGQIQMTMCIGVGRI